MSLEGDSGILSLDDENLIYFIPAKKKMSDKKSNLIIHK